MKKRILEMPLIKNISKSFSRKIIAVTILGLLIGFIVSVYTSNLGLNQLKNQSLTDIKNEMVTTNKAILNSYLISLSNYTDQAFQKTVSEASILRELSETALNEHYFLKESEALSYNGKYAQSSHYNRPTLLAQGYLLKEDGLPTDITKAMIDQTTFLNHILPPFYHSKSDKLQVYFTGGQDAPIYRVMPSVNLGAQLDLIYPDHNAVNNWDAFYPHFLKDWQEAIQSRDAQIRKDTPIYMPPSQDGASGEMILSIKMPLISKDGTKILGVISYDISTKQIADRIEKLKLSKEAFAFIGRPNGDIFAMNEAGQKILGLNSEIKQMNQQSFKAIHHDLNDSQYPSVRNMSLKSTQVPFAQNIDINGETYWVVTKSISPHMTWTPENGFNQDAMILGFVISEKDLAPSFNKMTAQIQQSTDAIILKQSILLLLLFASISTIIFLIYEQLSGNLHKLMLVTEQIKRRNFNIEIDLTSNDEFSDLANSFNSMTSEIKATVQQLTAQNELLKMEMAHKTRMDEQIAYMKQYDTLTGLPNKQSLYIRLDELILKSVHERRLGAAVVIGIDQFKKINEAYGMDTGDLLLKAIAERLRTHVQAEIVSRLTGDEFCIVFYQMTSLDDLLSRLEFLKKLLNQPFFIQDKQIYVTACCGVASFPDDAVTSTDLLKYATSAMVNVKESVKKDAYRFYDANIEKNIKNRIDIMNALRSAIERQELHLEYQPIVDGTTHRWVGLEALLRWHSARFGVIPPNIFIPLAEEMNFISEIERWVIHAAMKDLRSLKETPLSELYLSLNLSALDLDSPKFMDYLDSEIDKLGDLCHKIQVEITESVLINHYDSVVPRLHRLARHNIRIALDDFGTGYSSLRYIKDLPIDCLKIDKSFVKDYPDLDDGTIAKIVVNLANAFDLKVIAEGVETEKQAAFLNNIGCIAHQGYYYSRPKPLEELLICHADAHEKSNGIS